MAYVEHPEFIPPENKDTKIWRYMDLAKFLSIIDRRCLFFIRMDQLAEFDKFEGHYTNLHVQYETLKFEEVSQEWKDNTGIRTPEVFYNIMRFYQNIERVAQINREVTFVNSWHIKEYESVAMWKLYLSNHEGIAIQSTFNKLILSLNKYHDFDVMIGKVKYIDYSSETIPMGNMLSPFTYKRKSFEHEEELRALIWTAEKGKNDIINPGKNRFQDIYGLYVPVDLDVLIERVYVSPSAQKWIHELVRSLTKKYKLKCEIVYSDLSMKPLY